MDSIDEWSVKTPGDSRVYRVWRHGSHEIRVEKIGDGTWDALHNGRVVENHDELEDAVHRARFRILELMRA